MKVGRLGILAGICVAVLSPKTAGGRIPSFSGSQSFLSLFFKKYLFIWLLQVLVSARKLINLHCGMRDL